jgi:hypothetical protein
MNSNTTSNQINYQWLSQKQIQQLQSYYDDLEKIKLLHALNSSEFKDLAYEKKYEQKTIPISVQVNFTGFWLSQKQKQQLDK